ncbi:MAG TPA: ethanolamine permease [Actinomycetota bacterium]|jgi:ethanolamine permease|nr:ethanolamine permease [Actinomycetota bacterium]
MEEKKRVEKVGVVEYEHVGRQYMEHRALDRRAGVALIWGLGVGYVISGEYFSWNFGFANGGFGGMLIATFLAIAMYVCMVYSISEMATAFPVTGGPYAFARRTMGVWGGFATGIGAILEYVFATSAISVVIGILVADLFNIDTNILGLRPIEWIAVLTYAIFVAINLLGVQATLVSVFAITVASVVILLVWGIVLLAGGHWDAANFTNIAPEAGNSTFLPFGASGILTALPFAFWFYLAIEGVPLASEEARDPARDLPRGSILAMWSLVFFSAVAFFVGGGVLGAEGLSGAGAPISDTVEAAHGGENWFWWVVSVVGITGFVASFHSIIFAFSRIIYALSRAGYLPRFLSLTGRRKTPYLALIIPAILGLVTVIVYIRTDPVDDPANALAVITEMSVFGALTTYVLMMLAFVILRQREPNVQRPYRSPVGVLGAVVALAIAVVAGFAQIYYKGKVAGARQGVLAVIGVLVVGFIYFLVYSRHRLVAEAPEEEFALIERAEAELEAPV